MWNRHLWIVDTLPIGAIAGIEHEPSARVALRANVDPTLFIALPALSGVTTTSTSLAYQARVELEVTPLTHISGGSSAQVARVLRRSDQDAQLALEPFVVYRTTRFFARLGLLFAVNEPLGPGTEQGKVMSLHVTIGRSVP